MSVLSASQAFLVECGGSFFSGGVRNCRLSASAMDYAASFFEGCGSKWNYDALKNFDTISTPVQHHLQRVRVLIYLGLCVGVVFESLVCSRRFGFLLFVQELQWFSRDVHGTAVVELWNSSDFRRSENRFCICLCFLLRCGWGLCLMLHS